MNLWARLSLRASMALFAAISLAAMVVVGVLALATMQSSEALADRLASDVQLRADAGDVDMMHDALRAEVYAAQLEGALSGSEVKDAVRADLASHVGKLEKGLASLETRSSGQLRDAVLAAKPELQAYAKLAQALVEAGLAGKVEAGDRAQFTEGFNRLADSLDQVSKLVETAAAESLKRKDTLFARASWLIAGTIGLAGLLMGAFGVMFARTTLGRLGVEPKLLRQFASQIADGRLDCGLAGTVHEHSVAGDMLRMQRMLADTVRQIRANADGVATGSSQIAQSNQNLSQRTEQQASALEQAVSSMEQLASMVRQNADSARQANQLAQSAASVASDGGQVVSEVVQTMKGINDSSRKIADIIGVIDGIAFQTNILALNAAVEAARAGEQGRGFAVVASEVRSLAKRSADAAKEIKALISTSVERVEQGSALVDQAGATMTEVVSSIRRVTHIMGEISTASSEQSTGVEQIGLAVGQIDQATQQNAVLVEQSTAAAESLKGQAQQLVQSVAVFKLVAGAMGSPAAKPVVAAV